MKCRNGFVSNSSSSSFVIAIPKTIKTQLQLLKYLFPPDGEGQIEDSCEVLTYNDIAKYVWRDIDPEAGKLPANKKDIIEEIKQRYIYYACTNENGLNCHWFGQKVDELGGAWYYKLNKYCGSNKKLMDELRNILIKNKITYEKIQREQHEISKKCPIKEVPYASNYEKGKFTNKQIKAYDKYVIEREEWFRKNKKYQLLQKKLFKNIDKKYGGNNKLTEKIAECDFKNFVADTKDCQYYIVSYSDNDGSIWSMMEHSDIFRNIPHMYINHH